MIRVMIRPVAILLVIVCIGCRSRHETPSLTFPNAPVILISIDTLRADRLPLYGYPSVATPAIDSLGRDGIVYAEAWSHCPMTLPSHLSMLTGLLPAEHEVRNNIGYRFATDKHPSIPKLLGARGYASGAAVSAYVLRAETGIAPMFSFYDDVFAPAGGGAFADYQRPGNVTAAIAEKWIDEHAASPFFFMLHLYEPHVPYDPPEPFLSRYPNRYDGEIATADSIVGAFLDHLKQRGLYDRSLIILTSDHGEGLGDHGEEQHSILLYTDTLRVPLIVKLPGQKLAGRVEKRPVQTIDIAPTVLSLTGADVPAEMHGASLLATVKEEREIYGETVYPRLQLGWSDLASMARGKYHLIDGPRPELYDVAADPHERHDLSADERRVAADLRKRVEAYRKPIAAPEQVDPETVKTLVAMGYIGSLRAGSEGPLPNPVDHVRDLDRFRDAIVLSHANPRQAIVQMKQLLTSNPQMFDMWVQLAEMQTAAGDLQGAAESYKVALSGSKFVSGDTIAAAGNVQLLLGNRAAAGEAASAAITAGVPAKGHELLTKVAIAEGNLAEAAREAHASVETSRGDPGALVLLAQVLIRGGDFRGATAALDQAEQSMRASGTAKVFGLHAARGEILARSEKTQPAIAEYEQEIALFPSNLQAYSSLAVLEFISGQRGEVERTMQRMVAANPTRVAYLHAAQTFNALEDVKSAERWKRMAEGR